MSRLGFRNVCVSSPVAAASRGVCTPRCKVGKRFFFLGPDFITLDCILVIDYVDKRQRREGVCLLIRVLHGNCPRLFGLYAKNVGRWSFLPLCRSFSFFFSRRYGQAKLHSMEDKPFVVIFALTITNWLTDAASTLVKQCTYTS